MLSSCNKQAWRDRIGVEVEASESSPALQVWARQGGLTSLAFGAPSANCGVPSRRPPGTLEGPRQAIRLTNSTTPQNFPLFRIVDMRDRSTAKLRKRKCSPYDRQMDRAITDQDQLYNTFALNPLSVYNNSTSSPPQRTDPSQASLKAPRSAKACLPCRNRKVRCDAVSRRPNPCTNCALDGLKCELVPRA